MRTAKRHRSSFHHHHYDNEEIHSKRLQLSPCNSSSSVTAKHSPPPPPRQPSVVKTTPTPPPPPPPQPQPTAPSFPSYLTTPNLPPKIKLLCEIIATTPATTVESILDDTGLRVTPSDVEQVLKLSYSTPASAVRFFRWSGFQLQHKQSPYAWNLVVDMLGKNSSFDAMWDAVKSMQHEGLVSLATFASVFSSYVIAGRVRDAVSTFEVMERYGCSCNVVALNSLLSAICRDGNTADAAQVLNVNKRRIRPDADSYAILLEGWEKEMNLEGARETFLEMVREIGWDPMNLPVYDSFLSTLVRGGNEGLVEAVKHLERMIGRQCYPGIKFFRIAMKECVEWNDVESAESIWKTMVMRVGIRPDTRMYNSMVSLYCYSNDVNIAQKLLDEMIYDGAFPDSQTYNVLFQFLMKSSKLKEASAVLNEMIKNECIPSLANCNSAVKVFVNSDTPYTAIKVWKFMMDNYAHLDETGNLLVTGLCNRRMISEAVKYAEGMIEKGMKLSSSTLAKLKQSLAPERKESMYEDLLHKCKAR